MDINKMNTTTTMRLLLPVLFFFLLFLPCQGFSTGQVSKLTVRHTKTRHRRHLSPRFYLSQSSNDDDDASSFAMTVERPDPSVLLAAQPETVQQLGFVAICVSILVGTYFVVNLLTAFENILPDGWFQVWRDYTWPVPLGLIYGAAGVAHFAMKDTFTAMVP
jgi:hypothetical protein